MRFVDRKILSEPQVLAGSFAEFLNTVPSILCPILDLHVVDRLTLRQLLSCMIYVWSASVAFFEQEHFLACRSVFSSSSW
jgi:hypothetical protein